jgi:sugar O-acyltransferase (sialic acid O-acetyltransferase NeuD family)
MSGAPHARLLVFGAGGHGRVVADAAHASGLWQEIAFTDDRYPDLAASGPWPVVGSFQDAAALQAQYPYAALGVGHNAVRAALFDRLLELGYALPPVVHPAAVISPFASIAAGAVVLARAVVNIGAVVGPAAIVNSAAVIEHDCTLGRGVHVSPAAALAGAVDVGELGTIGIGAAVRQCLHIGRGAMVGAGAVVVADVADGQTVTGVPARVHAPRTA